MTLIHQLPFELLLMISYLLDSKSMVKFITAFKGYTLFKPFDCLLKLVKVTAVNVLWPLNISGLLSHDESALVRDASLLSKSVTFYRFSTVKDCDIPQTSKVTLSLGLQIMSSKALQRLHKSRLNSLKIFRIRILGCLTGIALMEQLSRMEQLRSLEFESCKSSKLFISELFTSISMAKRLTSFTFQPAPRHHLSRLDCDSLGKSLTSSSITHLQLSDLNWRGFLHLTTSLPHSQVTSLKISKCCDYYTTASARQLLENLSKSKVKQLSILRSYPTDDFAFCLSATPLYLSTLSLQNNHFTIAGMKALVEIDAPTLNLLDLRINWVNDAANRDTLMRLKPRKLKLLL